MNPASIHPGAMVRHRNQAARLGLLTGRTFDGGAVTMVEVQWGDELKYEAVNVLEPFVANEDQSLEGLVSRGRFDGIECLRSLLTYEKLRGDLTNVVYSMQTAEIDFYAHQFVPVLNFVQSPLGRLLIADEVGLGKTIEAGLIWTECRARFNARRLLVVCPPTLIPKWIRELSDRFDVPAQAADATNLLRHFEQFKRRGADHSFALVTSYHALRPNRREREALRPLVGDEDAVWTEADGNLEKSDRFQILRQLCEWNEETSFIDLAVFDEGHLMKNTATASHMVGRVLAPASASSIMLSATPLTNRTRDLYALLRLVDPDMFPDEWTFNRLRERNRPAVLLGNALAQPKLDRELCLSLLNQMPESRSQNHLRQLLEGLPADHSPSDRIAMQGTAQRLNELGAYLSRTRKVEVVQEKVIREPVVLEVQPSEEEKALYNGVLKLIRQRVRERGEIPSVFHLMASALSMASCLPVMANKLRSGRFKWGDLADLASMADAFLEEDEAMDFVGEEAGFVDGAPTWLADYDFEKADTKYLRLKEELLERTIHDKVIIFAFFKETLRYLARRLESDGLSCLMVTGDVTDKNERDRLLTSFQDPRYRVLLCSEVAAEGVDLQFCRVLVNYDLPWNPMRVEQRIGRIDRIGQRADTIVIVNLLTAGTIDASVYEHLHRKIGIFTETVGDVEGIIGPHLNQLTRAILVDELSPAQLEARIKATALAVEKVKKLESEVNDQCESLLGLRSILQEAVDKDRSLGRYVKPSELRRFADDFFKETYSNENLCHLNWDTPAPGCCSLGLSYNAFADFQEFLNRANLQWPKGFHRNNYRAIITFDPGCHAALRQTHRGLTLVSHLHPFMRWITSMLRDSTRSWHPVSAVLLATTSHPPGTYAYFVAKSSTSHPILKRHELLFRAIRCESGENLGREAAESLVNAALDEGRSWCSSSEYPNIKELLPSLQGLCELDHSLNYESFRDELELKRNSKRQQISSHFEKQIASMEKRLETLRAKHESEQRGVRGFESQKAKLESRLREEISRLSNEGDLQSEFKPLACGLIHVIDDE